MDRGVAIQAPAVVNLRGTQVGLIVKLPRMTGLGMASLAEVGDACLQESLVIRPVRIVAVHTVFSNGYVIPQNRTPLLGVALITYFIDRIPGDQTIRECPMRIVTIRAVHFALPHRVMRGLHHGGSCPGMAGEA